MAEFVGWLDLHGSAVTAFATVVLVAVTTVYAWLTREISKSTRESVKASHLAITNSQRQHRLSQFPLFTIKLATVESLEVCRVSIRNTSQVPALDVEINLLDTGYRGMYAFEYPATPLAPVERRSVVPPDDTFEVLVTGRAIPRNDRYGDPQRKSMEGVIVDEGIVKSDEYLGHALVHVSYGNVFGARFSHQERWELWQRIVTRPTGGDGPIEHLWLEVGHPVLEIYDGQPPRDT